MNKMFECIIGRNSSIVPVWFMRQAGRYLPEFREIRKHNQDFIRLCLNKKLVTEITLQPIERFGLDAAIIFSDILMIPHGLGQKVVFKKGEGPMLGNFNFEKLIKVGPKEFTEKMSPVYEAIGEVKKKVGNKNVIGFTGAPWTLLVYMLNRQSPKKNFNINKIITDQPETNNLLKKLEECVITHITKQIEAGANIIQLFDSWAGLLPSNKLKKYCYEPTLKILNSIKKFKVPIICFPKGIGKNYKDFCSTVKPDCINIDYEVDPKWAKENLKEIPIQGGLDPKILLKKNETIKIEVENYLNIFSNYPYVFNLGHGVLPETKPETIKYVTSLVQKKNDRKSS